MQFAISICGSWFGRDGSINVDHQPFLLTASTEAEAIGKGHIIIEKMKQSGKYPRYATVGVSTSMINGVIDDVKDMRFDSDGREIS